MHTKKKKKISSEIIIKNITITWQLLGWMLLNRHLFNLYVSYSFLLLLYYGQQMWPGIFFESCTLWGFLFYYFMVEFCKSFLMTWKMEYYMFVVNIVYLSCVCVEYCMCVILGISSYISTSCCFIYLHARLISM